MLFVLHAVSTKYHAVRFGWIFPFPLMCAIWACRYRKWNMHFGESQTRIYISRGSPSRCGRKFYDIFSDMGKKSTNAHCRNSEPNFACEMLMNDWFFLWNMCVSSSLKDKCTVENTRAYEFEYVNHICFFFSCEAMCASQWIYFPHGRTRSERWKQRWKIESLRIEEKKNWSPEEEAPNWKDGSLGCHHETAFWPNNFYPFSFSLYGWSWRAAVFRLQQVAMVIFM